MSQTTKHPKLTPEQRPPVVHYAPADPIRRFSVPTQTLCHILNGVGFLALAGALAGPVGAFMDDSSFLTAFYYMKSFTADLALAGAVFGLSRLVALAELLLRQRGV